MSISQFQKKQVSASLRKGFANLHEYEKKKHVVQTTAFNFPF